MLSRSEHKQGDRTRSLTLTRLRITITDSNTVFTGMISKVSLAAVRVSILAFNTAAVAERDPTLGGSKSAMIQYGGRWGRVGSRIVGHGAHTWSTYCGQFERLLPTGRAAHARRFFRAIGAIGNEAIATRSLKLEGGVGLASYPREGGCWQAMAGRG